MYIVVYSAATVAASKRVALSGGCAIVVRSLLGAGTMSFLGDHFLEDSFVFVEELHEYSLSLD